MLYRNKKENDLNEGKWVGVGGKFLPGETPEQCLLREVQEETGLILTKYRLCGVIRFESDVWEDEDMYLYEASAFENPAAAGERADVCEAQTLSENAVPCEDLPLPENAVPCEDLPLSENAVPCEDLPLPECSEGTLAWIPREEVLDLPLWEGDRYFLTPLLAGEQDINMTVRYQGDTLVEVYEGERNGQNN